MSAVLDILLCSHGWQQTVEKPIWEVATKQFSLVNNNKTNGIYI